MAHPGGQHDEDRHNDGGDGVPSHHAARIEFKIVLVVMPLPARPMDTMTGLCRPGTVTLTTRTEVLGTAAMQMRRSPLIWQERFVVSILA